MSDISTVSMINSLILTKEANKKNWSSGNLTYKLIIDNQTNITYTNLVITDILDTSVIEFIDGSVKINDIYFNKDKYLFSNNTLKINLDKIFKKTKITISFSVRKKYNEFFIIKNKFKVYYNDKIEESNYVIVNSLINRDSSTNNYCGVPFWRKRL